MTCGCCFVSMQVGDNRGVSHRGLSGLSTGSTVIGGSHQEKNKLRPKRPDALDALDASDATCLTRTQFAMALCIRTQLATAVCVRTELPTASAYRTEHVRAFSFWTQPCQGIFLLDAAMSGYFPSGRSRVRAFSSWTQPCQGIFLLDAAVSGHFPSGRSRVRAFSFWTLPCQGKWRLDDACYGTAFTLAVKARNIAANTLVSFANTQWVPGIVTQSSSIHSI